MKPYSDNIIETITKYIPKRECDFELVGFISKKKEIYTFGNDSKILGRLFEVIVADALNNAAIELKYTLGEPAKQTVYPDFYFIKPDGRRIAVDVKTTYRDYNNSGTLKRFGFTAGSFTSYLRDNTKNIDGKYSDYDKHYILGVLYTREDFPTTGKASLNDLEKIVPAYKYPEIFIQEKHRICGEKKGSGNTDNIGTIKSNDIQTFKEGMGPFSFMGYEAFKLYWTNHHRNTDSKKKKESLYKDIPEFIKWLADTKREDELAKKFQCEYDKYRCYMKERGWE